MDIKVLIKNIKCYCRPYQLGRPIVNAGVRYAADQAGRAVRRRVGDVVEYGNQLGTFLTSHDPTDTHHDALDSLQGYDSDPVHMEDDGYDIPGNNTSVPQELKMKRKVDEDSGRHMITNPSSKFLNAYPHHCRKLGISPKGKLQV
eukprot:1150006-Pelagomonas_calceolata.AAC.2